MEGVSGCVPYFEKGMRGFSERRDDGEERSLARTRSFSRVSLRILHDGGRKGTEYFQSTKFVTELKGTSCKLRGIF